MKWIKKEHEFDEYAQVITEEFVKRDRKIYIFGSSVTGRCNIDSDLDICIDADTSDGIKIYHMQKEVGEICDWNCDIVMYSNIGERLKKTIQEEGVVIYE